MSIEINKTNTLFQLAETAKKTPHFLVAILLSFIFVIIGQIIGFLIIEPIPNTLFNNSIWNNAFNEFKEIFFPFLFIILIVYLWVKFYEKRAFCTLGFTKENYKKKFIIGLITGIVMFTSIIAILFYSNILIEEKKFNPNFIFPSFLILISYLIQGSTEEIVFRGWLLPVLGKKLNTWIAILLSSVMFALLHGMNENITIIALLNLLLFGVFISLFALRQASIIGVCIWHAIWNWLQGNFYGLEVSGNKEGVTIFNFKEVGPDWLTGGQFGPEGGIIATFILLLGTSILIFRKKTQNENLHKNW